MHEEIEQLIASRINDVVKLELALFFQQNPGVVDGADGIACRLKRDARTVAEALRALAEGGVIERCELGRGRYVLYSYTRDPDMRALLDRLSFFYHEDPAARVDIIRRLMGARR